MHCIAHHSPIFVFDLPLEIAFILFLQTNKIGKQNFFVKKNYPSCTNSIFLFIKKMNEKQEVICFADASINIAIADDERVR